jgi:hypothetical protein
MKIIQWLVSLFKKLFAKKEQNVPERVFNNNSEVCENDWVMENRVCDVENNCLKVIYREKYGDKITSYCMVVFRNNKTRQYKFVAPWMKNKIIERSNIFGISVEEVQKSEMSNEANV